MTSSTPRPSKPLGCRSQTASRSTIRGWWRERIGPRYLSHYRQRALLREGFLSLEGVGDGPRLLHQQPEQVADLAVLGKWVAQGELRVDLVAVAPALPLAQHVSLIDELGEDPVCRPLGDADGAGEVAKPDAGITSHAYQYVRMIGQKAPPRARLSRLMIHIARKRLQEY